MFKKNVFGQIIWQKMFITRLFGFASYVHLNAKFDHEITGTEIYPTLPSNNVLLVSNHQTYFADVAFIQQAIHNSLRGKFNTIKVPAFMFKLKKNIFYIAAEETMKSGLLPKLMALGGAITIKRTWRKDGQPVKRQVDPKDTSNIAKALGAGWIISFPQGTTKPFTPGRKGTAHMIKEHKPIVIPIMIDGFRRAFDKKGLKKKKKGVTLKMHVKAPIKIDYDAPVEEILAQVMDAIEQSEEFNLVD